MDKTLILKPRLSEKAYAESQRSNTFVFDVPVSANKHTVARAVAAQYEVQVKTVNILNVSGKAKRTIRKGGRAIAGRQSDLRKAYVTLEKGQTLPLFAAIEEQMEAVEEAEKKADKKAAKTEKESK